LIKTERAEAGLIGPERIGQHKGVTSVIFSSGHPVTIPESVKLLGMNRKDGKASLDLSCHNSPTWHFDGHRDPLRLSL
jgi:hypothetical protein